jgi:hypothetical protein
MSALPKKVIDAANLQFEPCKIGTKGLEGLPSNDEFGEYMRLRPSRGGFSHSTEGQTH